MLLFVFAFALKGVLYPSKDITLTHKHGGVKTPARGSLTLEGKIKLGANKERKQSCWQLAELFNISKTAAANIKNEASIRKEYEEFKGNLRRKRKDQFNYII